MFRIRIKAHLSVYVGHAGGGVDGTQAAEVRGAVRQGQGVGSRLESGVRVRV